MVVKIRPRTMAKPDRSLDITALTIGMRDAYYHFPYTLPQRDLALLACQFALTLFELFCETEEQKQHYSFIASADNYKAGYKLGSQQCNSMDCKEHRKILAKFHKVEDEEGDDGVYRIFYLFKKDIEILIQVKKIKDIDDFNSKLEKGELIWQSK